MNTWNAGFLAGCSDRIVAAWDFCGNSHAAFIDFCEAYDLPADAERERDAVEKADRKWKLWRDAAREA